MKSFLSEYGMLPVLLILYGVFSAWNIEESYPEGAEGGAQLAQRILDEFGDSARVLIVTQDTPVDRAFAASLGEILSAGGCQLYEPVAGDPKAGRTRLKELAASGSAIDVIACTHDTRTAWRIFDDIEESFPSLGAPEIVSPEGTLWPKFLTVDNQLNIANQITIIAIIAIGMTMVIITAGIDLSVGSLIALTAVVACQFIAELAGGEQASAFGAMFGSFVGIAAGAGIGAFTGAMITLFALPPFIVTLAMMMVASGLAMMMTQGKTIDALPESFGWLGQGTALGLPNSVWLMILLYAAAHILMTKTVLGRYIYAVGGNPEAARLSGVPVKRVVLFVYVVSGLLAGVGGVVMSSQLESASPNYGTMYELYVIAAVVVGGTSLAGGEGKILGTLVGAYIIAVIRNGMNLVGIDPFLQKVVLGAVILVAVLIDTLKRRTFRVFGKPASDTSQTPK